MAAVLGVALLLFLIIRTKLQAFVALLACSVLIGLGAGMPVEGVMTSITEGMGSTLGTIAVLVGLGAMLGRMLEVSGGAQRLAQLLLDRFGEHRAQWSLALTGFIVAIPVFFDVGLIILIPLVYGLALRTGRPLVYFGLPLLAGLSATHAFIPPTPGPIAVAELLGADLGWVILFGAVCGAPATLLAGPVLGKLMAARVTATVPEYMRAEPEAEGRAPPSVGLVLFLIGMPLVLILGNTLAKTGLPEPNPIRSLLMFVGHPMMALLLTTGLCFTLLGTRRGYTRDEVQELATKALEPAGLVILITGAGGVLKQVLIDSGVGAVLAGYLQATGFPPLVLAFLVALMVRLMQGSATVAMLTGAGLTASLFADMTFSEPMQALMVIAIAAGATCASHVNDSGFWLVNRFFGLSVPDTLRTWTLATTVIGVVGLLMTLLLSLFVS